MMVMVDVDEPQPLCTVEVAEGKMARQGWAVAQPRQLGLEVDEALPRRSQLRADAGDNRLARVRDRRSSSTTPGNETQSQHATAYQRWPPGQGFGLIRATLQHLQNAGVDQRQMHQMLADVPTRNRLPAEDEGLFVSGEVCETVELI